MIVVIIVIAVIAVILAVTLGLVFGLKITKTGGGSNGGGNHGGGGGGNHGGGGGNHGGGGNNKKVCNIAIRLPADRTKWKEINVCNPCTGGVIEYNGSKYDCSGTGWQPYYTLNNSEICFPNIPDDLTTNLKWGEFESEFNYTNAGYCQKNTTEKPLISKPLPGPSPNPPSPPGPPPSPPTEKGCCCCPQGKDHKTSTCLGLLKDTCDKYAKDGCKWVQTESLCK